MNALLPILAVTMSLMGLSLASEKLETAQMSSEHDQGGLPDDKVTSSAGYLWASPEIEEPEIGKRLVSWLDGNPRFRVPSNAIKGGYDQRHNQYYYICKAYFRNGYHPGKFFRTNRGYVCHIPWGGKENLVNNFKVLVNRCSRPGSVAWVDGWKKFNVPAGTVVGGAENNYVLYICRGYRDNAQQPGKLFGGKGNWQCRYPWGGREYLATNFQVLVDNCRFRG